jgi:DNA-binding NarL/FixJ family response regulator
VTVRILLADDEALVRAGLRLIVESDPGLEVVGEVPNGREAVEAAARLDPDVVLMDVQMPVLDGLAATKAIVALGRTETCRVIILTTFDLDEYVYEALRAGASGFLLKRVPAEDLISGIYVVAGGEALLAASVTRRLISHFVSRPASRPPEQSSLGLLTEREREVFELIAQGLSNAEIAGRLYLTEGTVKTHVKHIFDKLEVRDRTQAVILAYDTGVVRPREG